MQTTAARSALSGISLLTPCRQHTAPIPLGAELDAAQLLRIDDVSRVVGLSQSQIYQLVAEGKFPAQLRLSPRCSRWRSRDVVEWIGALQ